MNLKKIFYIVLAICTFYLFFSIYNPYCSPNKQSVTKVIIIGATSGIGSALAKKYIKQGCSVGITGRRKDNLTMLKQELGDNCWVKVMDISKSEEARRDLQDLIEKMGGMDLLIISAGIGNTSLNWEQQKETIDVNVVGFVAIASTATDFFVKQAHGHLVGISSISALRGSAGSPVYSASKAFESNYLAGLRARFKRDGIKIYVTDIQPGLVDTTMGQASDFWRSTPQQAAEQIYEAIDCKYEHAYITKRWRIIAWFFKLVPDSLFYKVF